MSKYGEFEDITPAKDDDFVVVMRAVGLMQKLSSDIRSKLKDDPTSFMKVAFQAAGVDVGDEFHAHTVKKDEGLPSEPDLSKKDREVHFLKNDGDYKRYLVRGDAEEGRDFTDYGIVCCWCDACCCVMQLSS